MTNKLTLIEEDNGNCRVYYRNGSCKAGRLLCYQESFKNNFELYECTSDGEPSYSIDSTKFIELTPLPEGTTLTGKSLTKWLVKSSVKQQEDKINNYLTQYGQPTEEDMSINDFSREVIKRIDEVYGECHLVKFNLYGDVKDKKDQIAQKYQTGDNWNAFNFCADVAVPQVDDELIDLIYERLTADYQSKNDSKLLSSIMKKSEELGGVLLIWA